MEKGIIIWAVFLAVIAALLLVSRRIKKTIEENGIETDAAVSRVVDSGTAEETDINVYMRYLTQDGQEVEGILLNPRPGLEKGQQVRIKYHPRLTSNARLA